MSEPSLSEPAETVSQGGLTLVLGCAFGLMAVTFSAPMRPETREIAELDLIALAKLGTRALTLLLLLGVIASLRRDPRRGSSARALAPLVAFGVWGMLSATWSPLPAVSLGQACSFLVLVVLAYATGLVVHGASSVSVVLRALCGSLIALSMLILLVHLLDPEISGLGPLEPTSSPGVLHPTAAAATASLGLVMLVAAQGLWGWRWSRRLLVPGIFVHCIVLALAYRRVPIALAAVLVVGMMATLIDRRTNLLIVIALLLAAGAFAALGPSRLANPGEFGGTPTAHGNPPAKGSIARVVEIATRRDPPRELWTLNGRTEMWSAVWQEFKIAPVRGHGYFVTSRTGLLDVWSGPMNYTAHNLPLQALVTTGVIGALLFCWGLIRPLVLGWAAKGKQTQPLRRFLLVTAGWYGGWSLLASSILGPVRPFSVVFFVLLGMMLGLALSTGPKEASPGE